MGSITRAGLLPTIHSVFDSTPLTCCRRRRLVNRLRIASRPVAEKDRRTAIFAAMAPAAIPVHRAKTIHFVRHGQGRHNVAGDADYSAYLSNEYLDASLTDVGWAQCSALKKRIESLPGGGLGLDLIVSSPLMRTLQTTAAVFGGPVPDSQVDGHPLLMVAGTGGSTAGAISANGLPPLVAHELCREHMGVHPCDRRSEIDLYRSLFPAVDFSLVASNEDTWWQADVREPEEDLVERGKQIVKWLMARPERSIAVVSHSSFLSHLLGAFGEGYGDEVKKEIREGFKNCELRSLYLLDVE